MRVRTIKRRPEEERWNAEPISEIVATSRKPDPNKVPGERVRRMVPSDLPAEEMGAKTGVLLGDPVVAGKTSRPKDFRIMPNMLEAHGKTAGCYGCEHAGEGIGAKHSPACRERLEHILMKDAVLSELITMREIRRETCVEVRNEAVQVDGSGDVASSIITPSRSPATEEAFSQPAERSRARANSDIVAETTDAKRRRLMILMASCKKEKGPDTAYQKFQRESEVNVVMGLILNIEEQSKVNNKQSDVNRVLSALVNSGEFGESPHEIEGRIEALYDDADFLDDLNRCEPLDRKAVIKARIEEMGYFRKMGVYRKVTRAEMAKMGGEIIRTKWIDTNKGTSDAPNIRCRLVGCEMQGRRETTFT